jgi:hypothetical protein
MSVRPQATICNAPEKFDGNFMSETKSSVEKAHPWVKPDKTFGNFT